MVQVNNERFGKFILGLRKEKGLTQKELAERLYISDKAVSKWERSLSMPDIALLIPLSQMFGVTNAPRDANSFDMILEKPYTCCRAFF